jgi:hypothetical protein
MTKTATKTTNKKELRLEIKNQLTQSLSKWKDLLGEKKFNNKIKDAAKSFSKGLKAEQAAEPAIAEKPVSAPKVKKEKPAVVAATEVKVKEDQPKTPAKKESSKKAVSK